MKHLSEEELVEHYYGESPGTVRAEAELHLEACPRCAAALTELQGDLEQIKPGLGTLAMPARDAEYGERVWAALEPRLEAYPVRRPVWLRLSLWQGLAYAAACALLIAGAFYAGRRWEHRQLPTQAQVPAAPTAAPAPALVPAPAPVPSPAPRPVILVVLGDHLDRSERLLVELKHADAGSTEMATPLRDEARTLLAANRVCMKDAEKTDDPALTNALDDLDRLLAEMADQPGGLNGAAIARLQNQMKADGLLFEVRVLRSRLPERQSTQAASSKGGII